LARHSWEDYKGTRFYKCQQALVVEQWLKPPEEDALGLTYEEWDLTQDTDASQPSVAILILRAAGFTLGEAIPPALEAAASSASVCVENHVFVKTCNFPQNRGKIFSWKKDPFS